MSFADPDLRAPLLQADAGPLRQQTWQIAIGLAVRDHLQSGDLYLTESRNHGHFWNMVYDQSRWEQERQQGFAVLSLPTNAIPALDHLELELDRVASEAEQGLAVNAFARDASN